MSEIGATAAHRGRRSRHPAPGLVQRTRGASPTSWKASRSIYLLWSLLPVVIAVIFSFNAGRSRSAWQGFSLRWWNGDPFDSLFHNPDRCAAMMQTFKLSTRRRRSSPWCWARCSRSGSTAGTVVPRAAPNFTMLLSFVVPEIILGVSLFLLFTQLLKNAHRRWGPARSGSD